MLMESTTKLVLLAEDNNQEYISFLKAINRQPYDIQVLRLNNGYSLLNMLQTAIEPYAIFLDVNMPYKDGLATLHELREMERFKKVPVILFSQSDYLNNIDLAFEFGATFYFKKSGDGLRLKSIIEYIFDSPFFAKGTQPPKEAFFIDK